MPCSSCSSPTQLVAAVVVAAACWLAPQHVQPGRHRVSYEQHVIGATSREVCQEARDAMGG
jgi:hypothetical protein